MRGWSLLAGLSLLTWGCGSDSPGSPSTGGGNNVSVGNNFFSPTELSVPAGTTVTWVWAQGAVQHNVTFNDGPASATQSAGSFPRTFANPGTFTYFCSIHGAAVMHGTITVTAAGTPGGGTGGGAGGGGGYDYGAP